MKPRPCWCVVDENCGYVLRTFDVRADAAEWVGPWLSRRPTVRRIHSPLPPTGGPDTRFYSIVRYVPAEPKKRKGKK